MSLTKTQKNIINALKEGGSLQAIYRLHGGDPMILLNGTVNNQLRRAVKGLERTGLVQWEEKPKEYTVICDYRLKNPEIKKHYPTVLGISEELKNDPDHCYCPICNHRAVITCIQEGCKCCVQESPPDS